MKRIVRLTESDLTRIVRRVIKEQSLPRNPAAENQASIEQRIRASLNGKSPGISDGEITATDQSITIFSYDCNSGKVTYNKNNYQVNLNDLKSYCIATNNGRF
jgi:hypothetical protein